MEKVLIHFRLVGVEAEALRRLCAAELRRPRDQARHILRTELERRGLLRCVCASEDTEPAKKGEKAA